MGILELFILAVGLAMDAFAVSICKGLAIEKLSVKHMAIAGLWFGGFQAGMPVIGYLLGSFVKDYITKVDHWIAFILLTIIGGNMLWEAVKSVRERAKKPDVKADSELKTEVSEKKQTDADVMKPLVMFGMAVATSIDAFTIGITFALLDVNIVIAASFIGIVTFIFSAAGVKIGNVFGEKYEAKAQVAGGIILIILGAKILITSIF